jgi:SAM-dependent methyltransferase
MSDGRHWFEDVADHLGSAYLRYSFTKGTDQEVDFLTDALGLTPGARILDVGCGPGRHAHALAVRGFDVVGVDISERFVGLAREGAPAGALVTFERADARALRFDNEFDAVISLCQGAFGLSAGPGAGESGAAGATGEGPAGEGPAGEGPAGEGAAGEGAAGEGAAGEGGAALDPDRAVLHGMGRALKLGGRLALSAFSAYFQVRFLGEADSFDAERGVNHEHTAVRNEDGVEVPADLWTTCFTPRELRLLAEAAGLRPEHIWSVTPGDYAARPPDIDHPEFLMVATRAE